MYTKLQVEFKLKEQKEIIDFCKGILADDAEITSPKLWKHTRNPLRWCSAYFDDFKSIERDLHYTWENYIMYWWGNIKNYNYTIEDFIEIVAPHIIKWKYIYHYEEHEPEYFIIENWECRTVDIKEYDALVVIT